MCRLSRFAAETNTRPPVGSGPYVVAHVDAGRTLVFRRNPDYWGKNLSTRRGRFNFNPRDLS